ATVTDLFGCISTCSGTLVVEPRFLNFRLTSSEVILGGAGGTSNTTYIVLSSTDFTTPAALWTPVATNTFDANGQFIFTNKINSGEAQRYFRLRLCNPQASFSP